MAPSQYPIGGFTPSRRIQYDTAPQDIERLAVHGERAVKGFQLQFQGLGEREDGVARQFIEVRIFFSFLFPPPIFL